MLQRRQKNALTGLILLNDGRDGAAKAQMDLCMARAEAAAVPFHTFGWGRSHDPSSLWLLSQHTGGTYTFVRDWYGIRDAVAGCVGGLLAVGANACKIHLSVPERRWFRIRKVSGIGGNAVVSSDGADADIDLGELRFGERREMLIEVEMAAPPSSVPARSPGRRVDGARRANPRHPFGGSSSTATRAAKTASMTGTDEFFLQNAGLDPRSLETVSDEDGMAESDDSADVADDEALFADDVPLFEVNASYKDPRLGKFVSRLPRPVLLTAAVGPSQPVPSSAPTPSDPDVVRRRIELLCSDMMTRCLLLMSRRNAPQALRLMTETRRIIATISTNLPTMSRGASTAGSAYATSLFAACLEDVDYLVEAVRLAAAAPTGGDDVSPPGAFDTAHRNFAAQQAIVLRDQHAWVARSAVERIYAKADYALYLARRSADWVGS